MNIAIVSSAALMVLTSLLLAGEASAQADPAANPDAIVADTQAPSRKQGMVRIGKVVWKCSDRRCTARSRKPAISVHNCQALAELVGPIARFGNSSTAIPSYDLALCNVRAQINLARIEEARRRAAARAASGRRQNQAAPRVSIPPVVAAPGVAPSPSAEPITIRVTRLSLAGVEESPETTPSSPVMPPAMRIEVDRLALVGHGRLVEASEGTHLTVAVQKLELVGR